MRLNDEVRALERERIRQALEACGGNQTKAAEYLGMPRRTLVSKLAALDVERPRKKTPTREP
jgi:two-component system response regulator AtoC